jgi:putative SOS response-associated peptidase YedK
VCGRFAFYSPAEATAALFGARYDDQTESRYNIAPTQDIAAIRHDADGIVQLAFLRWGLVPFWAKDPSIGSRMINARAETVAEKPSFRTAYRKRRSLILADGFYEWHRDRNGDGDVKTPWYISRSSDEAFAFAGLWEDWTDKETGESLQTTTIVTTEANEFMSRLHSRMPVILTPDTAHRWMAGDMELLGEAAAIYPQMQAWPVDRKVNNARNQGADLIDPAGEKIRA